MIPESIGGKKDMGGESNKNVELAVHGNLKNSSILVTFTVHDNSKKSLHRVPQHQRQK